MNHEDVVDNLDSAKRDAKIREVEASNEDLVEDLDGNLKKLGPHRWQPGQSPNPGGRPSARKKLISQAYRRTLQEMDPNDPESRTFAELIAVAMCRAAANGDVAAAREIREVTEGKVPNVVRMEGSVDVNHILTDASDEELDDIIQTYLERNFGGASPALGLGGHGGEDSSRGTTIEATFGE